MNVHKLIFIFFLCGVAYGQNTPTSLTIQKDLRVQGQTVLGGVAKERDITMTADTIRIKNLDGTGTLLTIDVNGDVVRGTAGAGGVSGLNVGDVLYGASDGTIEQEGEFTYDETINTLLIQGGVSGGLSVTDVGAIVTNVFAGSVTTSDGTDQVSLTENDVIVTINGNSTTFTRASGGSSHTLTFPNAQGGANTRLTNDGSGNLSWAQDIVFEGSTDDANETTLTATDPTADRTVTIQDITGTIPMAVGTPVSLTGQTASIAATTAYTAPVDGYYAVYYNATITTAATTSCVLGPLQVRYTEATDNVVKTFPTSSVNFITQTNRNNTDAAIGGMFMVHAKAGTNIQYIMGYTSSGATAMQYNLEITVIKIR